MENKKRALGRGLEELFNSDNIDINSIEKNIYETANSEEIIDIPLEQLRPNPYQPRTVFTDESLKELATSIKEHGVFQPIIVKRSIKGYEIIAGERRYRASKLVGLEKIPAIVRNFTDEQMMEIALLENLQRENLSAIEEAQAYYNLQNNLNLTQEELANKVGKSRSHITNMLGLLRLPNLVQEMVNKKQISMGHARVLSKLEDNDKIVELAKKIVDENFSVRRLEEMANETPGLERKVKIERKTSTSNYKYVEELLEAKFDSRVKIKDNKIVINFINDADLNRILEIINVKE